MAAAPKYENFRDAFCAAERCSPEDFGRRILFRCMPAWRRPFARLILLASPEVFAADFGVIDSLGDARTVSMCIGALNELASINRVERGFRRGLMGFRVYGSKLSDLFDRYQPLIQEPEAEETFTPRSEDPSVARRESRAAGRETLTSAAVMMRRLRQAHGDLIRGVDPEEAARRTGFPSGEELLRHLGAHGAENPEFKWVSEVMARLESDRKLAEENQALKAMVADQSMEIARLKSGQAG